MLGGLRPERVTALIRDRVDNPGAHPERRLGLVIEGGGLRGVFSAGALAAIGSRNATHVFDAVFGTSAGALNAAYFLAGQAAYGSSIYYHEAASPKFINLLRPWRIADMDYLFDSVIAKARPLRTDAALRARSKFVIAATSARDGRIVTWDTATSRTPLLQQLKASSALPVFYNKIIDVDGEPLVDGGLSSPFPILEAVADGCTDLLVLLTRPADYNGPRPDVIQRRLYDLLFAHGNTGLIATFDRVADEGNRRRRFAAGQQFVKEDVNIAAIGPSRETASLVGKLTADPVRTQQAAETMATATLEALGFGSPPPGWAALLLRR